MSDFEVESHEWLEILDNRYFVELKNLQKEKKIGIDFTLKRIIYKPNAKFVIRDIYKEVLPDKILQDVQTGLDYIYTKYHAV